MMTNTYLPHVGGVARSVQTFTEEYRKLRHKVLVVAPSFGEVIGNDAAPEEGVVRVPALQQFHGSDFSVSLPLTALFNQTIDEFGANVIHSHHPFLLGDTALRIGANKHVPVVFTHHTLYEEYTHYVPFNSDALKQFAIELSTEYANLCDAVIAPSESIATLIKRRGVKVPVTIIPTGIDAPAFASGNGVAFRKAMGIPPKRFAVGHVGRLAPEKNLNFLTRAVARFLKRSVNGVFLVVGAGPLEAEMRRIFSERGLPDRLCLAGKRIGQELYDSYAAMDVFVFSSFSETQGLVVAEAMAAGLPVVALDASGVREVVRNGKNGFLLRADTDTASFAACLADLKAKKELRGDLRKGAFRTARKFSRARCAEKALDFYELIRMATRSERQAARADIWTGLLRRAEVEWGLLTEKTKAAVNSLFSETERQET
ncbi:MAG: glycosyltransferase [Verrucomicrobiales bacterium]|nr:glycosyltransferase [Verrucomicrobiales bacterium]